jgi:hypothetical protein
LGGTDEEVAGGEGRKYRDLAFYRCTGPANTPLPELTRVTGACRAIEKCSRTTKNEAGLDQYQVRNYRAWYARITLAMGAAGHDVVVTVALCRTSRTRSGTGSRLQVVVTRNL